MTEPTHLRVDRPSDGVVLITLDNPGQRNAMSDPMTPGLDAPRSTSSPRTPRSARWS